MSKFGQEYLTLLTIFLSTTDFTSQYSFSCYQFYLLLSILPSLMFSLSHFSFAYFSVIQKLWFCSQFFQWNKFYQVQIEQLSVLVCVIYFYE